MGHIIKHTGFLVTVTMMSDLSSKKIMSRAYLLYYLSKEFQIWFVDSNCENCCTFH